MAEEVFGSIGYLKYYCLAKVSLIKPPFTPFIWYTVVPNNKWLLLVLSGKLPLVINKGKYINL